MSGKPKKREWGGQRVGSGRKPRYMMNDYQLRKMMLTAKRLEEEMGKSLDDVLVEIAYGKYEANVKERLTAINIFKAFVLPKTTEQNISVTKDQGMAVRLPPKKEDPALKVVK